VNAKQEPTNVSFELPEEWEKDKEEMGVSAAEWVRRMVRLGRRQYGLPYDPEEVPAEMASIKTENDETADSDYVREFLLANLSTDEYLEIEELLDLIGKDIGKELKSMEREGIAESRYDEGAKLSDNYQENSDD
jgi:hypothetical protein